MKKTSKLLTLVLAFVMIFACSSCKKVIDGCKITEAVMTIEFYDNEGKVASTNKVTLNLYENNAPKTVAHVKKLIDKKYYDGTAVSIVGNEVTKGFAQIGNYYYNNGVWTEKEYTYGTIADESGRVIDNQKLTASSGAIVLRHDFAQVDGGVDRHDTGKGTLMFMLSGLVDVSESDFTVIGKILTDDGETTTSSVSNKDETDRSKLSSFAIINSVIDFREEEKTDENNPAITNKTTVWYTEYSEILGKDDQNRAYKYLKKFITVDDSGNTTTEFYKGLTQDDISVKLTSDEFSEITDLFSTSSGGGFKDEFYDFMLLPYRNIVIKSIRIKK